MANSELKLIYFDVMGRAEISRFVLAVAGKKYEDFRFTMKEWNATLKSQMPFNVCPVLEIDGQKFSQGKAIAEFLAAEFGLYGKTNLDRLKIDQVVQLTEDLVQEFSKRVFFVKDEAVKEEGKKAMKEEVAPKFLGFFEKLLQETGTGYLVGDSMTLADLVLLDIVKGFLREMVENSVSKFPMVEKLIQTVSENERIKNYLSTRKQTEM